MDVETTQTLNDALSQMVGNSIAFKLREFPGTEKEPVHYKFGKSHYGEGKHGPHFATWYKDHNVHIDDDGSFIVTPSGAAIRVKMNPEIEAALSVLKMQTGFMQKKAFEISPGMTTLAALGILAAGVTGGVYAHKHRKKLKKVFDKFVDPQFTLTSGGGPGVGVRLKGTPLIADMDPTGPGAGVLIPFSASSKALRLLPWEKTKEYADVLDDAPGSLYLGAEMLGPIPIPHIGVAAGLSDKKKIQKTWKRLKDISAGKGLTEKTAFDERAVSNIIGTAGGALTGAALGSLADYLIRGKVGWTAPIAGGVLGGGTGYVGSEAFNQLILPVLKEKGKERLGISDNGMRTDTDKNSKATREAGNRSRAIINRIRKTKNAAVTPRTALKISYWDNLDDQIRAAEEARKDPDAPISEELASMMQDLSDKSLDTPIRTYTREHYLKGEIPKEFPVDWVFSNENVGGGAAGKPDYGFWDSLKYGFTGDLESKELGFNDRIAVLAPEHVRPKEGDVVPMTGNDILHEEHGVHSTQQPFRDRKKSSESVIGKETGPITMEDAQSVNYTNYRLMDNMELAAGLAKTRAHLHQAGIDTTNKYELQKAFQDYLDGKLDLNIQDFKYIIDKIESPTQKEQVKRKLVDLIPLFVKGGSSAPVNDFYTWDGNNVEKTAELEINPGDLANLNRESRIRNQRKNEVKVAKPAPKKNILKNKFMDPTKPFAANNFLRGTYSPSDTDAEALGPRLFEREGYTINAPGMEEVGNLLRSERIQKLLKEKIPMDEYGDMNTGKGVNPYKMWDVVLPNLPDNSPIKKYFKSIQTHGQFKEGDIDAIGKLGLNVANPYENDDGMKRIFASLASHPSNRSHYDSVSKTIFTPKGKYSNRPTAAHETAHGTDPALDYVDKIVEARRKAGENAGRNLEVEIPAMVVGNAMNLRNKYNIRETGKRLEEDMARFNQNLNWKQKHMLRHGPQFTGDPSDFAKIKDWMEKLRNTKGGVPSELARRYQMWMDQNYDKYVGDK